MPPADDDRAALIEAAYEAPLDAEGWAPFLRRLGAVLGAPAIGISERAEDGSWIEQTWLGLDEAYERDYLQHFHRLDAWAQGALRLQPGVAVRGVHLVADDRFQRSEFFQDFCRPHHLTDFLGALLERSPETGLVAVGLIRRPDERRFADDDLRLLQGLVPHLRRALRLQRAVRASGPARGAGVDDLRLPALTVDARMRVLHANAAAHRLLAEGDGLLTRHAVLMATDPGDTARLAKAVLDAHRPSRAATSPACAVTVGRAPGRPRHTVVVLPHRRDRLLPDGAVLYVVQPDGALPSAALLRRAYGLTAAEARLAEAIASGLSIQEVADRFEVTRNTVRSQLRSVFAKTGTDRQVVLARLVASLGAIPADDVPYSGGATSIARR